MKGLEKKKIFLGGGGRLKMHSWIKIKLRNEYCESYGIIILERTL